MKQVWSKFDPSPLTCDPTTFTDKNSPNIAKSNRIFPEKESEDKALILTYQDRQTAESFAYLCLFFSILAIFRGKQKVNVKLRPFSIKAQILQKIFKQTFCLLVHYLW